MQHLQGHQNCKWPPPPSLYDSSPFCHLAEGNLSIRAPTSRLHNCFFLEVVRLLNTLLPPTPSWSYQTLPNIQPLYDHLCKHAAKRHWSSCYTFLQVYDSLEPTIYKYFVLFFPIQYCSMYLLSFVFIVHHHHHHHHLYYSTVECSNLVGQKMCLIFQLYPDWWILWIIINGQI